MTAALLPCSAALAELFSPCQASEIMMDGVRNLTVAAPDRSERGDCEPAEGHAGNQPAPRDLLILSDIRFLREGLAAALASDSTFNISCVAADLAEALPAVAGPSPPTILIDAALPGGLDVVARLRDHAPLAQIVVLALSETEADVIAWARAGVCGYVPRSTALNQLADMLGKIMRHEQTCSTRIAAGLLRWIAKESHAAAPKAEAADSMALTTREEQVVRLLAAGQSNKEIARCLGIGLATVKSHVHNVLGKLALERRGQVARWMRINASSRIGQQDSPPASGRTVAQPASSSPSFLGQEMD